ncbi:MAG: hypothetical protein QOK48_1592 [Blastocatellia bacterium]|jgi:hypothetical protein|nr:hypothetical protein [Blastocatellia bacterium]
MTDKENRKYQMFVRVRNFCTAHATGFAANSLASQLIAALIALITTLDGLIAEQVSGQGAAREGSSTRGAARAALRDNMEAISRTARTLALTIPGLDEKFRVPQASNDQKMIAAARGFARDAAPHSAQFIAHELPADFIGELNEDIAALQAAIDQHTDAVGDHVGARAAIDRAIDEASKIVRQLDTIIRNKFRDDPTVLAEWASASHTERDPKRKPAATTPPSPSPSS